MGRIPGSSRRADSKAEIAEDDSGRCKERKGKEGRGGKEERVGDMMRLLLYMAAHIHGPSTNIVGIKKRNVSLSLLFLFFSPCVPLSWLHDPPLGDGPPPPAAAVCISLFISFFIFFSFLLSLVSVVFTIFFSSFRSHYTHPSLFFSFGISAAAAQPWLGQDQTQPPPDKGDNQKKGRKWGV